MTAAIIIIAIILFIWWNAFLPFYKDRNTEKLVSDESKCFSPECRSIVCENGNREAVLMIHGYPTTPHMYSYSAARLRDAGYDVFAPLIPTFGADPEDFRKTNFTQWFNFIDDYYTGLRKRYEKVYVLGISMGGAMTLKLAEKYSSTPLAMNKIVSISAPVCYNALLRWGIVTNPAAYIARTIGLFRKTIGLGIVNGRPDGEDGNEEWLGYKGTVINHGLSLWKAFNGIGKDLADIKVPMFVMHDRGDRTVPFRNLAIIEKFCKDYIVCAREVEMDKRYRHSHHALLMYRSVQKEYTDEIIEFLRGGDE